MFTKKMKVQGIDPDTKHWIHGKVIEEGTDQTRVSWDGYTKEFDCWLDNKLIRLPLTKRFLLQRNAIQKANFPVRGDPKRLRTGDQIIDTIRKEKFRVDVNDPFESKVISLNFKDNGNLLNNEQRFFIDKNRPINLT